MTEPDNAHSDGVDLGKHGPEDSGAPPPADEPFDPYRFGRPDHPIPAEYAPPGYTGPTIPTPPPSPSPGGPPGYPSYPSYPENPFNHPPGTPYGPGVPPPPYGGGPPPPSPPYGPYGPQPPVPPPWTGYPQPKPGNGKAIAGLVLGILSVVFFWLSVLDVVLLIPALICGLLGLTEGRRTGSGRGMAIAGLVCTALGTCLAAAFTVVIVHAANQCGGFHEQDQPGFQQCLRDNLW
jgi:hypothetical protein